VGVVTVCNTREIAVCLEYFVQPMLRIRNSKDCFSPSHANFTSYLDTIGVPSVTLEAIYPNQAPLGAQPGDGPRHIHIQVNDTFYYRENFLNVAIRKTKGFEYYI